MATTPSPEAPTHSSQTQRRGRRLRRGNRGRKIAPVGPEGIIQRELIAGFSVERVEGIAGGEIRAESAVSPCQEIGLKVIVSIIGRAPVGSSWIGGAIA